MGVAHARRQVLRDLHHHLLAVPLVGDRVGFREEVAQLLGVLEVEALEILTGRLLEDDDRDEIDTVGGLVCAVAGRVPGRGEVVRHPTGVQFEVIEGDPRRLSLLKVRGAPRQAQPSGG